MSYTVEIRPLAIKDIAGLQEQTRERVRRCIDGLAEDPRRPGTVALSGDLKGLWRARAGQWRVTYTIEDAARVVYVVQVARRSVIYRDAKRRSR